MSRPPFGTLTVSLALVLGALVGGTPAHRGSAESTSQSVEVIGATAVCPDLRQRPPDLGTRVSVGAAPLPAGRKASPGTITAVRVSDLSQGQPVPVTAPGQVGVALGKTTNDDGLIIAATGELAAGLEVEQVSRGEKGAERGLAGLRCDPPQRESWFVGGATNVGDTTSLVLVNVDDTPATVDVTIFTAKGPADPRLGQGLTVQPHGRLIISLDTLAPDRGLLAIHVLSRRGRVAAGVRHSRTDGQRPLGVDWVPRTQAPSTSVVVPGIPEGPGARTLMISNPGVDDATVSVRVTAFDGQFVPSDLSSLSVPAGTTVAARLESVTDTSTVTASITSDGAPVIAGAFVEDGSTSGIRDFSYTGGTQPLSGPALLTDLSINRPTESSLILSAPGDAANVLVTPITVIGVAGKPPAARLVPVPAGRVRTLKLSTFYPPGTKTLLAVEVTALPGSGPVYAVRYLKEHGTHGPLVTLLDLQGPAQRVVRPAVLEDRQLG